MNLQEIEERVAALDLAEGPGLIWSLLLAYGFPKSSISRLQKGTRNKASGPGETLWKARVFDRYVESGGADLYSLIDQAAADERVEREKPRFLIVRDDARLLALDTKTRDTLDIPLIEMGVNAAFFLPWAGIEKQQLENLHYADVKAAERMARLYLEIVNANPVETQDDIDSLNVFFARLLFCFFAEDTDVFPRGSFTGAIASLTSDSGEDTAAFLDALFVVLDTPEDQRAGVAKHFHPFGYVNGKLFSSVASAPTFTAKARSIVIESGTLNWSQINPDIFGSMIQAVVHPGERQAYGMHYTSVENILKVIRPLFLDDLDAALDGADTVAKAEGFIARLSRVRVFDPACGSGNFLVIAYKELRRLEHRALRRIADLDPARAQLFTSSEIALENFYGIEIDSFAHEIATLSLWLAKHQMNVEFRELFGAEIPLIPLRDAGQIVCGNATRIDWEEVCPLGGDGETYVVGNPPYHGTSKQTPAEKADFAAFFERERYPKNLDYIALWFLKGAAYVSGDRATLAFVTTDSVCQGDHVALMWPLLYAHGVEITFAYRSFRWSNQARGNAGVTCAIVGLGTKPPKMRQLMSGGKSLRVANVGPYLLPTPHNIIVTRRSTPMARLPPMLFGSKPVDGGHLVLSDDDRRRLLEEEPGVAIYLRRYVGSRELLQGPARHCLWITSGEAASALALPLIASRCQKVAAVRRASRKAATAVSAVRPWRFGEPRHRDGTSIIVPEVSSERREIIPMGFLDADTVISNKAFAIYDPEPWLFALLQSRLHTAWAATVGGRLKTDYSYSSVLVYNTFPVPTLTDAHRAQLTAHTFAILEARERHPEMTLGDLYLPEKMPADLQRVHADLDATIDTLYGLPAHATEAQRLENLFARYEAMTAAEQTAA